MGSRGGSPAVEKLSGWAVQFYDERFKLWWTAAVFASSIDLKSCRRLWDHGPRFRVVHVNHDITPSGIRNDEAEQIACEVWYRLRRKAVRA